jgi:hypothetical protein
MNELDVEANDWSEIMPQSRAVVDRQLHVLSVVIVGSWATLLSVSRTRSPQVIGGGAEEFRRVWTAQPTVSAVTRPSGIAGHAESVWRGRGVG